MPKKPSNVTPLRPASQLRVDNTKLRRTNESLLAEKTRLKMQIGTLMATIRDAVLEEEQISLTWPQSIYAHCFPTRFAQGVSDSTRRLLWFKIMEIMRIHGNTTDVVVADKTVVTTQKETPDGE